MYRRINELLFKLKAWSIFSLVRLIHLRFFFCVRLVIARSDRKIVQMTSWTTVPFLASFSPPPSHGPPDLLRVAKDDDQLGSWAAAKPLVFLKDPPERKIRLVLTHVTDLQVGIPSIPLDTTNGLWKIMMALINNTFPLNTYSILHWLCLSLCLQVLVCTIFKVRSRQK